MNRKEFQEWLNNFPEDTEILILSCDRWDDCSIKEIDFVTNNDENDLKTKLLESSIIDGSLFYYDAIWSNNRKTLLLGKNE